MLEGHPFLPLLPPSCAIPLPAPDLAGAVQLQMHDIPKVIVEPRMLCTTAAKNSLPDMVQILDMTEHFIRVS